MKYLIVTGMSGAGKSNAIKCLEDLDYYCVDNMPASLIGQFMDVAGGNKSEIDKVAFVIDIRGGEFFDKFETSIKDIKERIEDLKIIYLEASDEVLIRRYNETRRTHPMSKGGSPAEGIKLERQKLAGIKKMSDYIIDTSSLKPNDLRAELSELIEPESSDPKRMMTCTVMSFGYKNGIPLDADIVFDVRFIPNPFYLKSMKNLTGNSQKVKDYVLKWDETKLFIQKFGELINDILPNYLKLGKTNLVIAFGCTGGQHRSVVIANAFEEIITKEGYRAKKIHRDL